MAVLCSCIGRNSRWKRWIVFTYYRLCWLELEYGLQELLILYCIHGERLFSQLFRRCVDIPPCLLYEFFLAYVKPCLTLIIHFIYGRIYVFLSTCYYSALCFPYFVSVLFHQTEISFNFTKNMVSETAIRTLWLGSLRSVHE